MLHRLLALLIVFAAVACFGNAAHAAAAASPPSLAGQAFSVTVFAGDDKKILGKLSFAAKDLTAAELGFTKVAYTITPGDAKHKKDILFAATTSDADGNTLKITGTVSGNEVNGTIERTPKKGDAKSLPFSGGKAAKK